MRRFKGIYCQLARTAVASLALLIAAEDLAAAGSSRNERSIESVATRTAGEPIMAIVSLRSQRITVYDADGWICERPFPVVRRDAKRRLVSLASFRKTPSITRTCTMMPTCPTCNDSHGRALLYMVVCCRDIRPLTAAFVYRLTSRRICSI